MHLRTIISALLIAALLPVSAFAGICDVNCRTAAMAAITVQPAPKMTHAVHHHHSSNETMNSPNRTIAQGSSQQHSVSHGCCKGSGVSLANACLMPKSSAVQAQRVSPKSGPELASMQTFVAELPAITEHLHRRVPKTFSSSPLESFPLPLRI